MTNTNLPKHIGFIVDGNRRWAKMRGLSSYDGHLAGYEALKIVINTAFKAGVEYVSAYIFSTENWKRSKDEVEKLMSLMLKLLTSDLEILSDNNIKLLILGSMDGLNNKTISAITKAERATANNNGGTLALCFNYGGQIEIVDSVKKAIESGISPKDISVDLIEKNLYHPEVPPIDIIVRTSGEERLSNFMLWRGAYSELMFIKKMWPDMTKDDVTDIITEYNKRCRRFGG